MGKNVDLGRRMTINGRFAYGMCLAALAMACYDWATGRTLLAAVWTGICLVNGHVAHLSFNLALQSRLLK